MKEIFYCINYIEKKWKDKNGLLVEVILIFFILNIIDINISLWYGILILFVWIVIWYIASGRYIFPSSKYIVVYCIKTNNNTSSYYKNVFRKLNSKLDTFKLNEVVKIYNISSEIINNTKQAENYRRKRVRGQVLQYWKW